MGPTTTPQIPHLPPLRASPKFFLTGQQEPFQEKLGRVGRTLLIQLLSPRNSLESTLPDSIHDKYFGHLWTNSVPGRKSNAPLQALDWADTLAIWINPRGTLARNLGHWEEDEEEEELPGAGPARKTLMDADSQRLGLTLLRLLRSGSASGSPIEDAWKAFMLAMSASGDLLTSLTHAITNPLAEDLNILSLQGVESLYREFLDVKRWNRDGPGVKTMIILLISEGLLAKVLEKTLLYNQGEGSQINTSTADLLLTLSLKAHTTDTRVRVEISRAVHILSGGWAEQIHDLLTGWLKEALFRFPWIWPTVRRARTIPLLMARVESTCHMLQNKSSNLVHGLRSI